MRITDQYLEIGGTRYERMDVVEVRAELGRLVVLLRDGTEREGPLLADADGALRDIRSHVRRHRRTDTAAEEEQADRERMQRALAVVREGHDRQP